MEEEKERKSREMQELIATCDILDFCTMRWNWIVSGAGFAMLRSLYNNFLFKMWKARVTSLFPLCFRICHWPFTIQLESERTNAAQLKCKPEILWNFCLRTHSKTTAGRFDNAISPRFSRKCVAQLSKKVFSFKNVFELHGKSISWVADNLDFACCYKLLANCFHFSPCRLISFTVFAAGLHVFFEHRRRFYFWSYFTCQAENEFVVFSIFDNLRIPWARIGMGNNETKLASSVKPVTRDWRSKNLEWRT